MADLGVGPSQRGDGRAALEAVVTQARPLYISAFEVLQELAPGYTPVGPETDGLFDLRHRPGTAQRLALPPGAVALLFRLKDGDVPFTLFSDFWSEEIIAREVAGSCGMLAIVDEYYLSSTGKMIEVGYALREKPILVFPVDHGSALRLRRTQGDRPLTLLSGDPAQAYDQVVEELRRAD
jgi:hypothetical protein